jgi:hypothetical protein
MKRNYENTRPFYALCHVEKHPFLFAVNDLEVPWDVGEESMKGRLLFELVEHALYDVTPGIDSSVEALKFAVRNHTPHHWQDNDAVQLLDLRDEQP